MITKATKIDNNTIEIQDSSEVVVTTTQFNYDYLLNQRSNILIQKQRDSDLRDKEVAQIDELIRIADGLKVVSRNDSALNIDISQVKK